MTYALTNLIRLVTCLGLMAPLLTTLDAAEDDKPFIEQNGLVVIEMEQLGLPQDWTIHNDVDGYWGAGYIEYIGSRHGKQPGGQTITIPVHITTTGTYEFSWRSKNGADAVKNDEANDSWLHIQADEFFGMKKDAKHLLTKPLKVWVHSREEFKWKAGGEIKGPSGKVNGLNLFATFTQPGVYLITVSGRSTGHSIDRMALWHSSASEATATAPNAPLAQRSQ